MSLWLDEILDLIGVRFYDLPRLLEYVPKNSGGVPLGYLVQVASVRALGYSPFSGRLPSAVFSVLGAVGIVLLAKRFGLRWPALALTVFCLFPLQLRYALEARPYSQALAISIWMTLAFMRLRETPTWTRALLYWACIVTGLYTQPYSVFVAMAHFCWVILLPGNATKRRLLWTAGAALLLAAVAFLPWYLYAHQFWRQSIETSGFRSTINFKTPLFIIRELIGAGYPGALLVLAGACAGLATRFRDGRDALFWTLQLACPVLFALLADGLFGYFLAIRQMIFLLVPLAILFAAGLELLIARWRVPAAIYGCLLIAILIYGNVRFFTRPREDWKAASSLLAQEGRQGRCTIFLPADSARLYEFFNPDVSNRPCPSDLTTARVVTIAISPYQSAAAQRELQVHLSGLGFSRQILFDNAVRVELYRQK
ncbi:MAG TPA: glycosyltransferase family 39 protein [Bryobacteraceae bacterium]|nr:glycosyltransferase family 39 protein [Bryobacteraceae bacterium]